MVQIEDILAAGRLGKHSPLYDYLWAHFDRLERELPKPTNWERIAAVIAAAAAVPADPDAAKTDALMMLDANGKPPSAATLRKTWWRVRRDKGKTDRWQKPAAPRAAPVPLCAPVQVEAIPQVRAVRVPTFDPNEGADYEPPKPQFRFARFHGSEPTEPEPTNPEPKRPRFGVAKLKW